MATTAELAELLTQLTRWVRKLRIDEISRPDVGSRAWIDHREVSGDNLREEYLRIAIGLAAMRVTQASACADAIVRCHNQELPAAPVHTLTRVVFEQSAWAHWLVDESLTTEERVARAASDELHGLQESNKLSKRFQPVLDERRDRLHAANIVPAQRPKSTAVAGMLFDGNASTELETLYRFQSALPHGSSHVLLSKDTSLFEGIDLPMKHAIRALSHGFDDLSLYLGWGGRVAFRAWACRTDEKTKTKPANTHDRV